MKKLSLFFVLMTPLLLCAQIGIKAGANFANVTNASSISNDSRTGFMAGIFLAPPAKGLISSRTEIVFSRQGYSFQLGGKTGDVQLDYILLPQLMGINLTKFVQLQLGAQMAFLLNARADSTNNNGSSGPYSGIMDYYNKFDYGFAAGAEVSQLQDCWLVQDGTSAWANYTNKQCLASNLPSPALMPGITLCNCMRAGALASSIGPGKSLITPFERHG